MMSFDETQGGVPPRLLDREVLKGLEFYVLHRYLNRSTGLPVSLFLPDGGTYSFEEAKAVLRILSQRWLPTFGAKIPLYRPQHAPFLPLAFERDPPPAKVRPSFVFDLWDLADFGGLDSDYVPTHGLVDKVRRRPSPHHNSKPLE